MPNTERSLIERLQDFEPMNLQRYLWAMEHLRADDVVMDAACGGAHGTFILSLRAAMVYGFDRSEEAIAFGQAKYCTKRHAPRMRLRVADLATADFGAAVYDAVVSLETIEHLTQEDGAAFLASVHRALKPGGLLLMSSPAIKTPNPFHLHEYETQELAETLEQAGFRVESRQGQWCGRIFDKGDTRRSSFSLWACRKA